ncbi:LysE family translocator [Paucibacter sp. PLA-PC-4]|uniref:LysE family translocator n=1 Tax=Paucibacter sp. PLA-PC-4 TaxID=2993655 RepID=UPI002248B014|nr:LysE family translocator [Paucibacter sp. PLA-PC-4]MCX2863259.1 LysE family translocator [Paucibacter sp. PLA-PC-4]
MDFTSTLTLFAQALLIGLAIAAPVGPIGLLTIQRSLQQGPRAGLATGLGASVADALYGAVGAYGVDAVITALAAARLPLALGGAAFLLYVAWGLWRAPAAQLSAQPTLSGHSLWRYFAGTVLLTLSNPATIFSFIAVFGALSARSASTSPGLVVLGVFVGSALWWLTLSAGVGRLRQRFDERWQRRVQRSSAVALAGFALWQLGGLLGPAGLSAA